MERALPIGHNAGVLANILPPFYEALDVPDRVARTARLQQRAIQILIKEKKFAQALPVLRALPDPQPTLEAECLEGMGEFRATAERYRAAGNLKEALQCFRSIPDLEAPLKLLPELGDHPAAESLEWISKLQKLVSQRPEKFTRVVTPAEKKALEELLERSLGVTRKKPAQKKAAARKRVPKKSAPQ
jgi:hypothetical protein